MRTITLESGAEYISYWGGGYHDPKEAETQAEIHKRYHVTTR